MLDTTTLHLKEQAVLAAARAVVQRAQSGGHVQMLLDSIEVLAHRLKDLDAELQQ
jgi:hypothetical protein